MNIHGMLKNQGKLQVNRKPLKKLEQTIRLLNEYYRNYTKYGINKSEIVAKITNLADLIHGDSGYITPKHFD
jgi:hypothetical protein